MAHDRPINTGQPISLPHIYILTYLLQPENIIIYHEFECGIGISISKITVCLHEACLVMTNGDPEGTDFSISPSHE